MQSNQLANNDKKEKEQEAEESIFSAYFPLDTVPVYSTGTGGMFVDAIDIIRSRNWKKKERKPLPREQKNTK